MVSIHEPPTAFLLEHFKMSRPVATTIVTMSCIVVGTLCSLSFGPLADVRPLFGLTFFDFFDFVSAKLFLPVGGIIISLFVGWRLDRKIVVEQLSNSGSLHVPDWAVSVYIFLLRWLIPIAMCSVFVKELGMF